MCTTVAVKLRKLALNEAQRAFPRRGQQDVSDYMAALGELRVGDAAAIEREGLSDRAIKRRLGAAAQQLGYRLKWARQHSPEALYFQVIGAPTAKPANGRRRRRTTPPAPTPTAAPAPEPTAPPGRVRTTSADSLEPARVPVGGQSRASAPSTSRPWAALHR